MHLQAVSQQVHFLIFGSLMFRFRNFVFDLEIDFFEFGSYFSVGKMEKLGWIFVWVELEQ